MNNNILCDCNIIHEDRVQEALKKMPKDDILMDVSLFFKILGDPTRVKILFVLDTNEMCVCDIANVLGMTKSAISHQLSFLKDYRIVKSKKEGKVVYYSLDDEHVTNVFEVALKHVLHKLEGENNEEI